MMYRCDQCDKRYKNACHLKRHKRIIHSSKKREVCEICWESFSCKSSLKRHKMRLHLESSGMTIQRNFRCEECDKSYELQSSLWRHLMTHEETKRYVCDICQKSFTQSVGLSRHRNTHKELLHRQKFTCEVCEMTFGRRSSLLRHMHRHSNKKPYTCHHCDKTFTRRFQVEVHILKKHQGVKLTPGGPDCAIYECEFCKEKFSTQGERIIHKEKACKNITTYRCIYCSNTFYKKQYLESHQSANSNSLICKLCRKPYKCKGMLFVHMQRHANKRNTCQKCNKAFVTTSELTRHMRRHEQGYECSLCGKIFPTDGRLKGHKRSMNCNTDTGCHKQADSWEIILGPQSEKM